MGLSGEALDAGLRGNGVEAFEEHDLAEDSERVHSRSPTQDRISGEKDIRGGKVVSLRRFSGGAFAIPAAETEDA